MQAYISARPQAILRMLVETANSGKFAVSAGTICDAQDNPILHIPGIFESPKVTAAFLPPEGLRRLHGYFDLLRKYGNEALPLIADSLSRMEFTCVVLVDQETDECRIVPMPTSAETVPDALMLSILVYRDNGVALVSKVGQCRNCQKWFMRKTRKTSQFCTRKCRAAMQWKTRKERETPRRGNSRSLTSEVASGGGGLSA